MSQLPKRGKSAKIRTIFLKPFAWAILLINSIYFCALASPVGISNSLPSKIITGDGKTYYAVKLIKVEPDGLLVSYSPESGVGLAKLKFITLPASLQNEFGYNPTNALEFETNQALAAAALSQEFQQREKAAAAAQAGAAKINVTWHISEPSVTYSNYDPSGPRPQLIADEPADMTATTHRHVIFDADFTFRNEQTETNSPCVLDMESATISLGLSDAIVLPDNASDKLKSHEEGHRKINEHFYNLSQKVLADGIEALADEKISFGIKDVEASKYGAKLKLQNELQTQCLDRLWNIASQANKRYDVLTDHGRNSVDSNDAAQQVIAEFDSKVLN